MTFGADFCFCKEPPPSVYKSSCPTVCQLWDGAVSPWTEVHPPPSHLPLKESWLFFLRSWPLSCLLKGRQQDPTFGNSITHATEGTLMLCHPQRTDTTPTHPWWGYNSRVDKGMRQWTQGLGRMAEWLIFQTTLPLQSSGWSSGICRARGSGWGSTFMIVTKEKVFVVEMTAVMARTCEFSKLIFKPRFTLVSGPSNSACVILGRELMEHPERFPWISRIRVSH